MKKPKQLRDDIRALKRHLTQVREVLLKRSDVEIAQIGKECKRTADAIGDILKTQELPNDYKVAVVGRFKTGKSSFVNELLGAKLANEDTNPETAAITTFRHGSKVVATVSFAAQEEWKKLKQLFAEDPKHVDAHRVKMWESFGKPKKAKDGTIEEAVDLKSLELKYVKPGGYKLQIDLSEDGTKKSETEFRRKLKEFTSGAKPHHCLVQAIEITSPAAILDEGVLLIDTPGLDDTERFRVSLTEKTVEDVDAVLFLTQSGEAYGQSEKDFLLSLLRKGTVKQLIVVITQVDLTYGKHVRTAGDNDEEPETLARRIERERVRISREVAATLNDLSQDDSPAMRRYREQLGNVEIAFTSAVLHRDWKASKPVPYSIDAGDPGGVEKLKTQLLRLLSTESRLALTAQNISIGARSSLLDLQSVLQTKLIAIRDIKDKEVAEQKLSTFRKEFGEASVRFEGSVKQQVTLLGDRLKQRRSQHGILIENITLLAEQQIGFFELNDVGRHWRSRRSGYWGYMHDFQNKVANRIFPKVQQMLGEYTESFAEFTKSFEVHLNTLSSEGARISESLQIGASLPFNVTAKLHESLERSLQSAQELISAEELRVNALLEDFVTDEVSERIDERRKKVADIWGTGTTKSQESEVREFYREVKALLTEALEQHLLGRAADFSGFLVIEAEGAPRDALDEVQILLEQATDNIRAAATALIAGQKETAQALMAAIVGDIKDVLVQAEELLQVEDIVIDESMKLGFADMASAHPVLRPSDGGVDAPSKVASKDSAHAPEVSSFQGEVAPIDQSVDDESWFERVQNEATVAVNRMRLTDGTAGWPYEKIFHETWIKGALRIRLIDPFLALPHQIRNLKEFLLHIAEVCRPKQIEVVTSFNTLELTSNQDRALDTYAKDLFQSYGVSLSFTRTEGLHDRYLILGHGVVFKLGRGLDIYKPATGLAAHRPANRRVRATGIDVFAVSTSPLVSQN
jgi:signal recognition particle receptor subunit beta